MAKNTANRWRADSSVTWFVVIALFDLLIEIRLGLGLVERLLV